MPALFRRPIIMIRGTWEFLALAPAARWTVAICLAVFGMQWVCDRTAMADGYTFGYLLLHAFGLCPPLFAHGFVWQVFTYMAWHGNAWHLALNCLTILLFGAAVEVEIGSRRFLRALLLGGVVGGLAWVGWDLGLMRLAAAATPPAWLRPLIEHAVARRAPLPDGMVICIGASGGVFALIGAYAAIFPRRRVVVFLGWPVTLRARDLAILLGVATVACAIYGLGNVAYVTHLFGGLAGYFYGLRLAAAGWGDTSP
jgi:membrane associated rhomboid family serine protease